MEEVLARYTFLPWAKRGLSTKLDEADNFNDLNAPPAGGWAKGRPEVVVRAKVKAKRGEREHEEDVDQKVQIIGPGDIIGINRRIVVKTEPRNLITNFEPNYFPYIEFYQEEFLWRYTPAIANDHKLRPWLALIVLKESEFERDSTLFGKLPSILVKPAENDPAGTTGATSSALPDPSQMWAWGHVHLNGDVDSTNTLNPANTPDLEQAMTRFRSILAGNPDHGVSRLLCPRRLEANTNYYCFLIPSFETGRLAGLGAEDGLIDSHEAQKSSFGQNHSNDADHLLYVDHFPVYYEWEFVTGTLEDFESLVDKLEPIEVDRRVGKRPMDIQNPGLGVSHGPGDIHNDGILMLEGALLPPRTTPEPDREPYPWSPLGPDVEYRRRLADLINLSEDLRKATFPPDQFYGSNPFGYEGPPEDITDDPIITPDLYGRWHALTDTLDTSASEILFNNTWLYESNLDPRSRSVAGLGVKHVKNNQEKLMDKAWGQLGEVIEANRRLKWGQFSVQVSNATYIKHLAFQPAEQVNAMANKLFTRIKIGNITAFKHVTDSPISSATQSYAFRKIERPQSPLMKRMDPESTIFTQNTLRVSMGNNNLKAANEKLPSDQQSIIPLNNIDDNVNTITHHNIANAIYATMEPGSASFIPDLESELRFQYAVRHFQDYFEETNWQGVPEIEPINLQLLTDTVIDRLDPKKILPKMVYRGLRLLGYTPPPANKIVPVMAYPVFEEATYSAVKDLGVDFLIPNLDLIPNNSVTLLESNQKFIEAFMLGLNHEMGRELLWREFLTDQRGSYFRQFWDSVDAVNIDNDAPEDLMKKNLDIHEIHTWLTNTELGTHSPRPGADTGLLVLVIRGDLLKKYPDTVIYAQKAKFPEGSDPSTDPRERDTEKKYPVFSAEIEPDIHFFGFELNAVDARGDRENEDPGWFFVIQERPGEIRFGTDVPGSEAKPAEWNDLNVNNAAFSGEHLNASNDAVTTSPVNGNVINGKAVRWGFNATNMAQILYQNPVLLAVHSDEMIP